MDTKKREEQLHDEMRSHSKADETFLISCSYLLELLQRASDLFERSQPAQKNQLLRFVLANAKVEGEKLVWDLKSPFSGIAQCVKTKEWLPGLDAKSIIDIQVEIQNLNEAKQCIPLLEQIGYCYAPYKPYMHWFCKPSPMRREFHLQLLEPSHPQWNARLAFRDHLRMHPDVAEEYVMLKRRLSTVHRQDQEAYTEAKTSFVESIVREYAKFST